MFKIWKMEFLFICTLKRIVRNNSGTLYILKRKVSLQLFMNLNSGETFVRHVFEKKYKRSIKSTPTFSMSGFVSFSSLTM